jgi:hypothetical protein
MKLNTKNVMKSTWMVEDMNINWRSKDGAVNNGMPRGKRLKSKNSRRAFNHALKRRWKRQLRKQFNQEISEI